MNDHGSASSRSSRASSIFSSSGQVTVTSSSTIPGLGALSGKVIKRLGSAVVNQFDAVLIRRRLSQIENVFRMHSDNAMGPDSVRGLYSDILELSRPVYSLSIRTRALRLIMGRVGAMEFEDLVEAVVAWPLSESESLLRVMLKCLSENVFPSARLMTFYVAGKEGYKSHLPYSSPDGMSRASFWIPFLSFIALASASNPDPAFSRFVMTELNMFSLVTEIYPGILEPRSRLPDLLLPARLFLRALLESLDSDTDSVQIDRLRGILTVSDISLNTVDSDRTLAQAKNHCHALLASIRSRISYSRETLKHMLDPAMVQQFVLTKVTQSASGGLKLKDCDVLKLIDPAYSFPIRSHAFENIMSRVGGLYFEDLAAAVVECDMRDVYDLLKLMLLCFEFPHKPEVKRYFTWEYDISLNRGLEAYKTHLPYTSTEHMATSDLCIAFLLFLSLAVSISPDESFSRVVIGANTLGFIIETYPGVTESNVHWPKRAKRLLPAQFVLRALLEKLNPVEDISSITQLHNMLSNARPNTADGFPSPLPYAPGEGNILLASIRANISYLQHSKSKTEIVESPHILLLGSQESGKTTALKQISKACSARALHSYSYNERMGYVESVAGHALMSLVKLVAIALAASWNPYEDGYYELIFEDAHLDFHSLVNRTSALPRASVSELRKLVAKCHRLLRNRKIYLPEYTDYFLDSLPRIVLEGYTPPDEDIIRCYTMTTGVHTTRVNIRGKAVSLLDFGGPRPEQKKWLRWMIHDSLGSWVRKKGAIIFIASLSDYDQVASEDPFKSRMQESLEAFNDMLNSDQWIVDQRKADVSWQEYLSEHWQVILFLNKTDEFINKLPIKPLEDFFPDFPGGSDHNAACDYLANKFLALNNTGRDIRVYFTSAVDQVQITGDYRLSSVQMVRD
ncbi:hypothetical protein D9757_010994 [Collybiopsis confluens]|uniref:Uncharacterized protein n=1 Tax=Collybiopsis confluens TaxID=2823264 RepID=A0A8H5GN28_9AGAR|nr:hypothetical protein D9757_010994 [Collybiopsis confluens]